MTIHMCEPSDVRRGEHVRNDPKVSVVIPAWRGKPEASCWIDEALDSVRAQTYASWEAIVVDDGSPVPIAPARTDDVVMVRQPNTGPGGARNLGVALARGPLIAFLDSDDRWRPRKLELQVALHERRPELALSGTNYAPFDEAGLYEKPLFRQRRMPRGDEIAFEQLFFENCIPCSSTMMPRAMFAKTPGMSRHRRMGEDFGLWLRLAMLGPVGYIADCLLEHRVHGESLTQGHRHAALNEVREREVYAEFLAEHPELRDKPFVRAALARIEHEEGWTRMKRREWGKACRHLVRSLRLEPRKPKVWVDLGRAVLGVKVSRR